MREKPERIEPVINTGNKLYKVCSLNVNMPKSEFFYQFAYPKNTKTRFLNCNNNKETGRPDHISFHRDGTVHLTLKPDSIKLGKEIMIDRSFIPTNKEIITPLLVHSIYPVAEGDYYLPVLNKSEIKPDLHKINEWPSGSPFSVIIFLTPDNIENGDVLNYFGVKDAKYLLPGSLLGSYAGRIRAWKGWAIDYFLTDLVLPINPEQPVKDYHASFAFTNLHLVFGTLLEQRSNQLIHQAFSSI